MDFLFNGEAKEISVAVGFIYLGLLYFLPPKIAKKIEPFGKFLQFIAGTPTGFGTKKK